VTSGYRVHSSSPREKLIAEGWKFWRRRGGMPQLQAGVIPEPNANALFLISCVREPAIRGYLYDLP
jgi:hypothetical protein